MKQNGIGTSNIFVMRNKVEMEYYFRKTLIWSTLKSQKVFRILRSVKLKFLHLLYNIKQNGIGT